MDNVDIGDNVASIDQFITNEQVMIDTQTVKYMRDVLHTAQESKRLKIEIRLHTVFNREYRSQHASKQKGLGAFKEVRRSSSRQQQYH